MIRGTQKKMIVVRTHDSRVFEEAYFVMRPERETVHDESDMLSEANRIICRNTLPPPDPLATAYFSKRKHRICSLLYFLFGFLMGCGGILLFQWLG